MRNVLMLVAALSSACGGEEPSSSDATTGGRAGTGGAAGSGLIDGTPGGGGGAENGGRAGSENAPGAAPLGPWSLMVGAEIGCAILGAGEIVCWGEPSILPVGQNVPPSGRYERIDGREAAACAYDAEGGVVCWGNMPEEYRTRREGLLRVGGDVHDGCALDANSMAQCWGLLADDTPSEPLKEVAVFNSFACGISLDDHLKCWGAPNERGLLNFPPGQFTDVTIGIDFACALDLAGSISCWGMGEPSDPPDSGLPLRDRRNWGQATPPAGQFSYISAGTRHACAIALDGHLECWGAGKLEGCTDGYGTCGQAVPPEGHFVAVGEGYSHSCGITVDGEIKCWGSNTGNRSTPPKTTETE